MSSSSSYVMGTLLIIVVLFLIPSKSQIKSENSAADPERKRLDAKILHEMDEDEDDEFEVVEEDESSSVKRTQYDFEDVKMWRFRREVNNLLVKIESLDVVSSSSFFSTPSKDINKKITKNEEIYDEIESGSWPSMRKDKGKLLRLKKHSEDLILEIETFLESIDKFTEVNDELLVEYSSLKTRFTSTFQNDPKFGKFDPIVLEDDDSIRNIGWWLWKTETTINDIEETIFNVKIRLRDLSFQVGEILEEHRDKLKKLLIDNNMVESKDQQKVELNENESADSDEEDPEVEQPGYGKKFQNFKHVQEQSPPSVFDQVVDQKQGDENAINSNAKWDNENEAMQLFRSQLNEVILKARAILRLTHKGKSFSIMSIYSQVERIGKLEASLKEDKSNLGELKELLSSTNDQIEELLKRLPGINDLMKHDVLDKMKILRNEFKTFQEDSELDLWVLRIEKIFKDIRMIAAETDENVHMLIKEFTELKSDHEVKMLLYHEDLMEKLRFIKKDYEQDLESEKEKLAEKKRKRVRILAAKISQNKNETFKDKMKVPKKNLFTVHREEL